MTNQNNSSMIKDEMRRMRCTNHYLAREFSNIIKKGITESNLLHSDIDKETEEKLEKETQEFLEKKVIEDGMTKQFISCLLEDLFSIEDIVKHWIKNPEKEVSKTDMFLVLSLVVGLQEVSIIKNDLDIKAAFKKEPGIAFNKSLILLSDLFQSIRNGFFVSESKGDDNVLLAIYSIIYGIVLMVLNSEKQDFVNNTNERHHKSLIDDNGEIKSRVFIEETKEENTKDLEETEVINDKEEETGGKIKFNFRHLNSQDNKNKNNVEIDLSNISTSNKRKEVISEFESKNNDSEELPNLERI